MPDNRFSKGMNRFSEQARAGEPGRKGLPRSVADAMSQSMSETSGDLMDVEASSEQIVKVLAAQMRKMLSGYSGTIDEKFINRVLSGVSENMRKDVGR